MNLPAAETAGYPKVSPPLTGGPACPVGRDEGEGEYNSILSPLTLSHKGRGKHRETL